MSTELTNTSKLREFVEELKKLNIEIVKPSINRSYSESGFPLGHIASGFFTHRPRECAICPDLAVNGMKGD